VIVVRFPKILGSLAVTEAFMLLSLVFVGGCGDSEGLQKRQRQRADTSRRSVQLEFQDFRTKLPQTMWSGAATAGFLPCGTGGISYLVQSSILFYNQKASSADYLRDVQRSLEPSGWIIEPGSNGLDFRLKKGGNEFHFTGFKGVSHARSWLYGTCIKVDSKVGQDLRKRSQEHCRSTVRSEGATSSPDIGSLCSWGRLP
jgi:hypothetical protein